MFHCRLAGSSKVVTKFGMCSMSNRVNVWKQRSPFQPRSGDEEWHTVTRFMTLVISKNTWSHRLSENSRWEISKTVACSLFGVESSCTTSLRVRDTTRPATLYFFKFEADAETLSSASQATAVLDGNSMTESHFAMMKCSRKEKRRFSAHSLHRGAK